MTVTFVAAMPIVDDGMPLIHHLDGPGLPSVSLSNRNGGDVLEVLGLVDNGEPLWIGSTTVDEFKTRVLLGLGVADLVDVEVPDDWVTPRFFVGGRPPGYLEDRLHDLTRLVAAVTEAGHSHIGWH